MAEPTSKDRKRAARQIAALLVNPATPDSLIEEITEELKFYTEFLDYTSPRIIEILLDALEKAVKVDGVEIIKDDLVQFGSRRIIQPASNGFHKA